MIEIHPFGSFVPKNARYLILGSFPGRRVNGYDWFYGNQRNQFWPILEAVYGIGLRDKAEKQKLFTRLGIAITDIILKCERKANNNLDTNLAKIVYNTKAITAIFKENKTRKIFFTSRFVEHLFKKQFKNLIKLYPEVKLITLPSPSPRYAAMSRSEKIARYKDLLPVL